jgi:hypothetical protein
MNPITNGGSELQLPPPTVDYQTPLEPAAAQSMPLPGQAPGAFTEQAPLPPPPLPPLGAQPVQANPIQQPVQQPIQSAPAQVSVPTVADDQDLIEKEWVSKAKQIVEKTRSDPYQQSQELTAFKSDYMQKRYNKIMKLGE